MTVKELKNDILRKIESLRIKKEWGYEYENYRNQKECDRLEKLLDEINCFLKENTLRIQTKPEDLTRLPLNVVSYLPLVKEFNLLINNVKEGRKEELKEILKDETLRHFFEDFFSQVSDKRFLCIMAAATTIGETVYVFEQYKSTKERAHYLIEKHPEFFSDIKNECIQISSETLS